MLILAINPGSTSTKFGIFIGRESGELQEVYVETIRHSAEELAVFPTLSDQLGFRRELILQAVENAGYSINHIEYFIGRGGLHNPLEGGTYRLSEHMLQELRDGTHGVHASNLGGLLAHSIAKENGKDAYIADPVVVDELEPVARLSGHPLFPRVSIFHALNHKAIARKYCREYNKEYTEINLIIAHLGGGVSVAAHKKGRVIDVNNALDGDGAFSPERSGALPAGRLIDLCYSGNISYKEARAMVQPKGGVVAYFGTNDLRKLEAMAKDDEHAALVLDAMCYQIAKDIGAMAAVLNGEIDAILLTGGIAHSRYVVETITKRVDFLGAVRCYPGEDELAALAGALLRVINKEDSIKEY